jgi:alpha-D-xyloside xylohydrolase
MLSSHSRLHGSDSYRVPWAFDDEAVDVTRRFTRLKMSLMPYLARLGEEAHTDGVPVMRPMVLEHPADRTAALVDTQYMLGDALLVAPVFRADGQVEYYVPEGTWTRLVDGAPDGPAGTLPATVTGPRWVTETHGFDSLPVLVRAGSVLPVGARDDAPEYDWADGVTLRAFALPDGYEGDVVVPRPGGASATFHVRRDGQVLTRVRRRSRQLVGRGRRRDGGCRRPRVGDARAALTEVPWEDRHGSATTPVFHRPPHRGRPGPGTRSARIS